MPVYETTKHGCEVCGCTRSIKLGKSLADELNIPREDPRKTRSKFVDIGRLKANRRKQQQGLESLKTYYIIVMTMLNLSLQEQLFQAFCNIL